MKEITDHSHLREFLLSEGLTPLDAGSVIRNKRIRELFSGRHLQSIEISKLKTEIKELKKQNKELIEGVAKKLSSNPGRISKVTKEEVWVEIYPDGDFRRYIIGRYNLKIKLNLIPIDADKFCNDKTPLHNGNSLRHGRDSKRVCIKCQTEGTIGTVFDIQKTHIDNRCFDCRKEYAKEYRLKTVEETRKKAKKKREYLND